MYCVKSKSFLLVPAALLLLNACATAPQPEVMHAKPHKPVATASSLEKKNTLQSYEAAYKRNSEDPATALNYAQSLRENGRLQRAAIILDPFVQGSGEDDAPILSEYGAIQAAMSNYPEAEQYARKAIVLDAKNGQAYHVLGIALDAEGKHDEAEVAFRKALANWQGDPAPVLNNLGLNLAGQNYLDEALATLQRAVSLDPDRKEFQRNLRIVTAMKAQSPPAKPGAVPAPRAKPPKS